jgi:Ca-activated chloride channel homolog
VPRLRLSIAIATLAGVMAGAQSTAPPDYTITDNVNLVLLDVSVKNAKGNYVQGLRQENFHVAEDGHPRTITHFANVDVPVTVGLVIDISGSMRLKRPEVVTAGLAFARESNPHDQFFVVNFNNGLYFGLPAPLMFTDELRVLRSALYYGKPAGQTALYDAIAAALHHLEASTRDKRTLIIVSDGGDNVSRTSLDEVLAMAQASRATIYTVGLLDPNDRDINPKVLHKLSALTGGAFLRPQTSEDVMAAFKSICRDIRSRYSLGYVPDLEGSKKLVHKVKVTAKDEEGRKLSVLTRTSYTTALSQQFTTAQQNGRPMR